MNTCTVSPDPAEVLTTSPLGQLRRLVVETSETEVIISGQVSSFYLKQMAQEMIRSALGQRTLRNEVEVRPSPA